MFQSLSQSCLLSLVSRVLASTVPQQAFLCIFLHLFFPLGCGPQMALLSADLLGLLLCVAQCSLEGPTQLSSHQRGGPVVNTSFYWVFFFFFHSADFYGSKTLFFFSIKRNHKSSCCGLRSYCMENVLNLLYICNPYYSSLKYIPLCPFHRWGN
jgi:hypothetical protein